MNFPITFLERERAGPRVVAQARNWSASGATIALPSGLPSGWSWVRVAVTGVASEVRPMLVGQVGARV